MAKRLDDDAITHALDGLPDWRREGDSLVHTVTLPDFRTAIAVVGEVARLAEEADHHPDIDIRWRTVTFRCSTHSTGGITEQDVRLAATISEVARKSET